MMQVVIMKTLTQILFFWFMAVPPLWPQSDLYEDNLMGIDFQALGTSFHYAGLVKNGLYFGVEGGLLPDKLDWVLLAGRKFTQENTIWSEDRYAERVNDIDQLIFVHIFSRWKPKWGWFEVDAGLRYAVFDRSGHDIDSIYLTRFFGAYIKPAVGLRKVKFGARLDCGYMEREFLMIASPLIRINFK